MGHTLCHFHHPSSPGKSSNTSSSCENSLLQTHEIIFSRLIEWQEWSYVAILSMLKTGDETLKEAKRAINRLSH